MKEMILKTKRLLLRELKQDDFDDICKLLQDPIVMYAYEGAFSKKEVQEWLDKQLRRYQNISLTSTKYTPSYGTQISPLKK